MTGFMDCCMSSIMPIRGLGRPLVATDWTVADEWKTLETKTPL